MKSEQKISHQNSRSFLMNDIPNIIREKITHNKTHKSFTKFPDKNTNQSSNSILVKNKALSPMQNFKKSCLINYNKKNNFDKKVNFSFTQNSLSIIEPSKCNLSRVTSLKKSKKNIYQNNSKNKTINNSKNNMMNNIIYSIPNDTKYLKTCTNRFPSKKKSKKFLSLNKNKYLNSDSNLSKHKKNVNSIECYDKKNQNFGLFKLVSDIKKINDINEKFKQKIEQIKFHYNSKDKIMKKKFSLYERKLNRVIPKMLMDENIKEFIQTKKNTNKNNNINYIKSYRKDFFNVLNLVKDRKAKEKQFIENAEDIMFKNNLLINDVNKINQRLNYKKLLYENAV